LEGVSPQRQIQFPGMGVAEVFAISAQQRAHPSPKSPIIFQKSI
jgi:hypothetical protein